MNPVIANNKPCKVTLEKSKEYFFCVCGKSGNQPFCDGSHAGTGLKPKLFTPEKTGSFYLCQCKQSANIPYCDGTHKQFTDAMIGEEGPAIQKGNDEAPDEKTSE
ncbi:hypothetical protein Mag101_03410 [Microbulbifer agarilyticus]|uniref:Iron-binding zinc finger CDGSH type domain-containing protein n=1 Tax=Microbulbifer agarilyticus TaxID=260552 RepID=A0A1Q2M263_9GAMM|nr:CDGSH iron-sulfur domain-containing protein [Microbulbifer agarilyticus]AQQ66794.1 hypothetical protein Mag101_03410 [Microbulbifer agarilyticus]